MWHGRAAIGPRTRLDPRLRSAQAQSVPPGHRAAARGRGRAVGLDDAEGVEARPASAARRGRPGAARATAASPSGPRSRSTGGTAPSMKRVTSQPSGSRKATTSGPTPTPRPRRVASCSARRSMPSSSVSWPATRSTYASPSERDLDVVVRDPAAEQLEPCVPARPEPLDSGLDTGGDGHARIRSPAGSKSGSVGHLGVDPLAEDLDLRPPSRRRARLGR